MTHCFHKSHLSRKLVCPERVLLPQACVCEAGVVAGEPEDASGDGPAPGVGARAHSSRLLAETLERQERAAHAPRAARVTLPTEGEPPRAERIYRRTTKMLLSVACGPPCFWKSKCNVTSRHCPMCLSGLRAGQMIPA